MSWKMLKAAILPEGPEMNTTDGLIRTFLSKVVDGVEREGSDTEISLKGTHVVELLSPIVSDIINYTADKHGKGAATGELAIAVRGRVKEILEKSIENVIDELVIALNVQKSHWTLPTLKAALTAGHADQVENLVNQLSNYYVGTNPYSIRSTSANLLEDLSDGLTDGSITPEQAVDRLHSAGFFDSGTHLKFAGISLIDAFKEAFPLNEFTKIESALPNIGEDWEFLNPGDRALRARAFDHEHRMSAKQLVLSRSYPKVLQGPNKVDLVSMLDRVVTLLDLKQLEALAADDTQLQASLDKFFSTVEGAEPALGKERAFANAMQTVFGNYAYSPDKELAVQNAVKEELAKIAVELAKDLSENQPAIESFKEAHALNADMPDLDILRFVASAFPNTALDFAYDADKGYNETTFKAVAEIPGKASEYVQNIPNTPDFLVRLYTGVPEAGDVEQLGEIIGPDAVRYFKYPQSYEYFDVNNPASSYGEYAAMAVNSTVTIADLARITGIDLQAFLSDIESAYGLYSLDPSLKVFQTLPYEKVFESVDRVRLATMPTAPTIAPQPKAKGKAKAKPAPAPAATPDPAAAAPASDQGLVPAPVEETPNKVTLALDTTVAQFATMVKLSEGDLIQKLQGLGRTDLTATDVIPEDVAKTIGG